MISAEKLGIEAVKIEVRIEESEEKINVCEGIQGMIDDAVKKEKKKMYTLIIELIKEGRGAEVTKILLDKEQYQSALKQYGIS